MIPWARRLLTNNISSLGTIVSHFYSPIILTAYCDDIHLYLIFLSPLRFQSWLFSKSLPKQYGCLDLLEPSGPVQACNVIGFITIAWVNTPRASLAQEWACLCAHLRAPAILYLCVGFICPGVSITPSWTTLRQLNSICWKAKVTKLGCAVFSLPLFILLLTRYLPHLSALEHNFLSTRHTEIFIHAYKSANCYHHSKY